MQADTEEKTFAETLHYFCEAYAISLSVIAIIFIVYGSCICVALVCRQSKFKGRVSRVSDFAMNWAAIWRSPDRLRSVINRTLNDESFASYDFGHLVANRPWYLRPGPGVEQPKLPPTSEWLEGQAFPNGQTDTKNDFLMLIALWKFLYKKKQPHWATMMNVIVGVIPALMAQVYGLVVHEFRLDGSKTHLLAYGLMYIGLKFVEDLAGFQYQSNVPGATTRTELRQLLQRQFLQMEGELADRWPPGRCAVLLDQDVSVVSSCTQFAFFDSVRIFATSFALLVVIGYNQFSTVDGVHGKRLNIAISVLTDIALLVLFLGAYALVRARRANHKDLVRRTRSWKLLWMHLATYQIHERRRGDDCADRHHYAYTALPDVEEDVELLGKACLVHWRRDFHSYFVRLICTLIVEQGAQMIVGFTMIRAGSRVINGRSTVGEAVSIVTAVNNLAVVVRQVVDLFLNIHEGHAALVSIANIINLGLSNEEEEDDASSVEAQKHEREEL
eukprot:TRINITY_DN12072_c0_g1_i6.p1 TRINITY_DN12072_c0_g1~~TRINITY_DN12072_c0_g1_i6.p1  ORF type:complete len:501 (-),score=49.18 TRINITY_DN12072_c0_g1_i6:123-1625(-)